MRARMVLAAFLILSFGATACRGEDVRSAGEEPMDLTLWTMEKAESDTITVQVSASTRSEHGSAGLVRVRLSQGIALIAGDTVFSVPARRVLPPTILKLRLLRPGSHEVLATLSVGQTTGNSDLVEVRLPLVAEADSITGGTSEVVRSETTLNGRRYRFGGFWLVPLGEDEEFSIAEFARTGTKPRLLSPITAHCAACPAVADTVTFVVVIDRSGKVIQARRLDNAGQSSAITKYLSPKVR